MSRRVSVMDHSVVGVVPDLTAGTMARIWRSCCPGQPTDLHVTQVDFSRGAMDVWIDDILVDGWQDHVESSSCRVKNDGISEESLQVIGSSEDLFGPAESSPFRVLIIVRRFQPRRVDDYQQCGTGAIRTVTSKDSAIMIACPEVNKEALHDILKPWVEKPWSPVEPEASTTPTAIFSLILATMTGPTLIERLIPIPVVDLPLCYGDDFAPVHDRVLAFLKDETRGGLGIFRGPPGCGKTMYIKHLASLDDMPNFVYCPVSVLEQMESPTMIAFVMEKLANTVLVVEDAEALAITKPDGTRPRGMSTLLEFGDGILGDLNGMKIILTLNNADNVDPALLRKGRCLVNHRFGAPITPDRLVALSAASGVSLQRARESAGDRELVLADFWGNRE